jgi:hypothetical protein
MVENNDDEERRTMAESQKHHNVLPPYSRLTSVKKPGILMGIESEAAPVGCLVWGAHRKLHL